jgi:uncharacterized protein YhaN
MIIKDYFDFSRIWNTIFHEENNDVSIPSSKKISQFIKDHWKSIVTYFFVYTFATAVLTRLKGREIIPLTLGAAIWTAYLAPSLWLILIPCVMGIAATRFNWDFKLPSIFRIPEFVSSFFFSTEKQKLIEELQRTQETLNGTQEELEREKLQNTQLTQDLQTARHQVTEKDAMISSLTNENGDLEKKTQEFKTQEKTQEKKLEETQQQLSESQQALHQEERVSNQQKDQISQLQRTSTEQLSQIHTLTQTLEQEKSKSTSLEEDAKRYQQELQNAQTKISSLTNENNDLKKQTQAFEEKEKGQEKNLEEIQQQLRTTQQQLAQSQQELRQEKEVHQKTKTQISEQNRAEIERLKKELAEEKSQKALLEKKLQEDAAQAQKETETLSSLTQALTNKENSVQELTTKIQEQQATIDALQQKIDENVERSSLKSNETTLAQDIQTFHSPEFIALVNATAQNTLGEAWGEKAWPQEKQKISPPTISHPSPLNEEVKRWIQSFRSLIRQGIDPSALYRLGQKHSASPNIYPMLSSL